MGFPACFWGAAHPPTSEGVELAASKSRLSRRFPLPGHFFKRRSMRCSSMQTTCFQPHAYRVGITTFYFKPGLRTLLTMGPRGNPSLLSPSLHPRLLGRNPASIMTHSIRLLLLTIGSADDGT